MSSPLRVLCLDIEGGYGGSSRSLFYMIKHLDRNQVDVEVWCKREGPIQAMYHAIGIPTRVVPWLPKISSLPRCSRNMFSHLVHARDFFLSANQRQSLVHEVSKRFDVVHFNHEALYLLARWMRKRLPRTAFVMHNRTMLHASWFARSQARTAVVYNDVNVFISEHERKNVCRLAGWEGGLVISNVVEIPITSPKACDSIPAHGGISVGCLANYSWLRGIDRLVDVAVALRDAGRRDIRFVVAGNMKLSGSLPGQLGEIASRHGFLRDYAVAKGVDHMFVFLGHVRNPEQVLAVCQILARPSREDNPWGRDVLEGLAAGRPVLACGTHQQFVAPGLTGFLYPPGKDFQAADMAADIVSLADDGALLHRMSEQARARVRQQCDGKSRASDLLKAWRLAVASRSAGQR